MTLGLHYAARSHIGLVREGNEDSAYAGPRLLAVADGMGGHAAGEVASAAVIATLTPLDEARTGVATGVADGVDLVDALRSSALAANEHLRRLVAADPALEGMGTTLTAVLSAGDRVALLHVGDSRAYLLRDDHLQQITRDHTLVQALIDEGRITPEEATTHPQRSLVTRALDGRAGLELDLSVHDARVGDRYLLCSDGLTGPVPSLSALASALGGGPPQEAVDRLVSLALRGGGPDNITVLVADVVPEDPAISATPVLAGAAASAPAVRPVDGQGEMTPNRENNLSTNKLSTASLVAPAGQAPATDAPPVPLRQSGPRGHRRLALVSLALTVVSLLVVGAGWAYVRNQVYVGADGGRVAVFRGVRGTIAGFPLATLDRTTTIEVHRLSALAATQVDQGIVTENRSTAALIVTRLTEQAAEPCPTSTPRASSAPAPGSASAGPTATPSPAAPSTATTLQSVCPAQP